MEDSRKDEVTSRDRAWQPLKRQDCHIQQPQRLGPVSVSAQPQQMTEGRPPTRLFSKMHMHLTQPLFETSPARKRLCTRTPASEPPTPEISPRQSRPSAVSGTSGHKSPAAAQLSHHTSASTPEALGAQQQSEHSCSITARDMGASGTVSRHAQSSDTICSPAPSMHSEKPLSELAAGETSLRTRIQVTSHKRLFMPEHKCQQCTVDKTCRAATATSPDCCAGLLALCLGLR